MYTAASKVPQIQTWTPSEKLETGLPSLSQVRLGTGTPEASHSNLTGSFTTTVIIPPLLEIEGGTNGHRQNVLDNHNQKEEYFKKEFHIAKLLTERFFSVSQTHSPYTCRLYVRSVLPATLMATHL